MDPALRKAWTTVVAGADLDRHMAGNGQAQANAGHFVTALAAMDLPRDAKVLVPGAGTGQLFDWIDPAALAPYAFTLTDINPGFLAMLRGRLDTHPGLRAILHVDDIERPKDRGPFDAAIVILVLEHIDWKAGIAALADLAIPSLAFVIQRNDGEPSMVVPRRDMPPTIRTFAETAHPGLVPEAELTAALAAHGYAPRRRWERPVADEKVMVGLLYGRGPAGK
jgi:hypothetical protein